MGPVFGLYTQIRANRIRSVLLMGALVLLVDVMVFAGALFGEATSHGHATLETLLRRAWQDTVSATPWVIVGCLVWGVIAFRFNQRIIDRVTGARGLTREQDPGLYNMLENLCISRWMAVPRLELLDDTALNAYATGLTRSQYSITVTSGLREALTDEEMEAVLAHELTHIRNEDVRMMVVAMVIAGIVGFFAEFFFRVLTRGSLRFGSSSSRSDSDSKGSGGAVVAIVIAVVLVAVAWFLSQSIKFALSRSREYMADAGAVELTKNPDAMISALLKIEGRGEIERAPSGIMEMCIDNPRSGFVDLFATHPSIESRVDALVRYAGGQLPLPEPPAEEGPWDTVQDSHRPGPWG